MSDFRLGTVPSSSVLNVYSLRDQIWFDPPYQRMSDVWTPDKRQILIDSILNGYDIPKLYFHEFYPTKTIAGKKYKYAIVDGKQRLISICSFIEGSFALADDMDFIADPAIKPGNLTYAELAREYPMLKTRFDGFVLPIVTILTDDIELIEDMFSRLNEAVPLNAAEKRNALGGPIPPEIRSLAKNRFFIKKLPFSNARYRHFELATKFLYITEKKQLPDTKKVYLDEFVRFYREKRDNAGARRLAKKTRAVLEKITAVFVDNDNLLRSLGTVVLYYYLFLDAMASHWELQINRSDFEKFERIRKTNHDIAEANVEKANYQLLEYDRLMQSPNDSLALRYRYAVLRQYVGPKKGRPTIPGED
jgi:hypothetical protein